MLRAAPWKYGGASLSPGVSSELQFEKRAVARFGVPVGGGEEGLLPQLGTASNFRLELLLSFEGCLARVRLAGVCSRLWPDGCSSELRTCSAAGGHVIM